MTGFAAVAGCAGPKNANRFNVLPLVSALPPVVVRLLLALGWGCVFAALL
jgi:hypothetical protein